MGGGDALSLSLKKKKREKSKSKKQLLFLPGSGWSRALGGSDFGKQRQEGNEPGQQFPGGWVAARKRPRMWF